MGLMGLMGIITPMSPISPITPATPYSPLKHPSLPILVMHVLIRLIIIGEFQSRPVPIEFLAVHADRDVAEQDRLGEHRREVEVRVGDLRLILLDRLNPL